MSRFRYFPYVGLPILAGSALLITGALAQQTPPAKQPTQPATATSKKDAKADSKAGKADTKVESKAGKADTKAGATAATAAPQPPPPKADPKAVEALTKAIDLLDPKKLGWLDTTVSQQVETWGLSFKADGRYRSGPDYRLRLELNVHLAGMDGQSLVISDGTTVWNSIRVGKDKPTITRYDLKKIKELLNSPGTMPQLGDEFYKSQAFQGVMPLLQNLRQQMVFTKLENDRLNKHDVLKMTGVWSPQISQNLAPQNSPWQPFIPRNCTLYLDRNAPHWPYRLEWWGPMAFKGEDKLIMKMEFHDPKIYKPGAHLPEQFAQAFTFNPGEITPVDRTKELEEQLRQVRSRASGPGTRPGGGPPTGK